MAISLLNAGPSTLVAQPSDLPYSLVTPGDWAFSGGAVQSGVTYEVDESVVDGKYVYTLKADGVAICTYDADDLYPIDEIDFYDASFATPGVDIYATRVGINLVDRAVNAVSVSTDTTLTLPALVDAGRARDFLVRLAISGSTVPTITFAAPTGETIVYETDGDEFPVPDSEGTWLYSFTETAAHTFAVALKKVSVVTQGGV